MDPSVRTLILKRFRSIPSESITFDNPTVLVGRNGSGNPTHFFNRVGGAFVSNVSGVKPVLEPSSLALPVVGGEARFAPVLRTLSAMRTYAIDPAKLREMQDPDSGLVLKSDGSNA